MKIKKEKLIMTIVIGIMFFLLTMTIFMQFKIVYETERTDINSMKETDLRTELASWKTKYEETREKYDETAEMLNQYKEEISTDAKTRETLEKELENLEISLGKTDVEGEGVIIQLSEKSKEELEEEEEIISVKAEDLIYIVNYLKDAGAEAISINDERIVSTTDFADIGESIRINGRYLRESVYVIKAIGNSSYLESSIFGKGGYVEALETSGIKASIEKQNRVRIGAFNGDFETNYIKEEK